MTRPGRIQNCNDARPLILVVDDDARVRRIVREALEPAGLDVVEASDGESAVSVCRHRQPGGVLVDVDLPGMSGVQTCNALRLLPGSAHIPIIMMVRPDATSMIERAYAAGATDFVTKPINYLILAQRILGLLRTSEVLEGLASTRERLLRVQRIAGLVHWEMDLRTGEVWLASECMTLFNLPAAADGTRPVELLQMCHPEDIDRVRASLERFRRQQSPLRLEHRVLLPDGSIRYVQHEGEHGADPFTGEPRILGTAQDITKRKRIERQVFELAFYDSLTGLPNRRYLHEHLQRVIARARRSERFVAVLALDLDLFKRINDTLGHLAGDELLKIVADRLSASLRESDVVGRTRLGADGVPIEGSNDNAVARIGGDEFITVLGDMRRVEDAGGVAQRILDRLAGAFHVGGQEVYVTASIGIAVYPSNGDDADALIKNADAAMYSAKDKGRNNFQFYTDSMNAQARHRLELEADLRRALPRGELALHYQPMIDTDSGRVRGVEALLRWYRPDHGLVSPAEFIPIAEDTGLIVPIGDWVLRTACSQLKAWHEAGLSDLRVAVNVSARQFRELEFAERVATVLEETGLEARFLELEITESLLMEDTEVSRQILEQLEALGAGISLDDFGTGYSSLSYLTSFPIDRLKIDRSFVQGLGSDSRTAAITRAMVALAHSLELDLVAEGVESFDQLDFFSQYERVEIQGYLFSRPLPPEDLWRWIESHHGDTRGARAPQPPRQVDVTLN